MFLVTDAVAAKVTFMQSDNTLLCAAVRIAILCLVRSVGSSVSLDYCKCQKELHLWSNLC